MAIKPHLSDQLKQLPDNPGVYRYYDADGALMYVGKAKNLKKRVMSYFNKVHDSKRIALMVSKIDKLEYTIVSSEMDALLLENILIKQWQPRYNVMLKDDKTYPYIVVTSERFPRVLHTRQPEKIPGEVFGPYANVSSMYAMLDLIRGAFPLRNCTYHLSQTNIAAGKFRVCLEYQIGNCTGPCEGLEEEANYLKRIQAIRQLLQGRLREVIQQLEKSMVEAAQALRFEDAQHLKEQRDLIGKFQAKSAVVSHTINDVDVFSIAAEPDFAFVNYMRVAEGMVIQSQTVEMKPRMGESQEDLLELAIGEMRNKFRSTAREVIIPFEVSIQDNNIRFTVPKSGEKKKLLDLSLKNAWYFKKEKINQYEKLDPEIKTNRILKTLQSDLNLATLPKHIECFDNSNIQGNFPVSALVVFKDAKPSKKDYRHFQVKTVIGPNDFATMEEAVFRRYSRVLAENEPLPDLIIIDGGKGQLSAACASLAKLNLFGKIPILGIAKRLEELYRPDDPYPLHLDKKSESLKLIQQLRDEAHRFGITHHRKLRSKGTIKTQLQHVDSIGPESAERLLKHFKSVQKIKAADLEALAQVVGMAKAKKIRAHFESQENE